MTGPWLKAGATFLRSTRASGIHTRNISIVGNACSSNASRSGRVGNIFQSRSLFKEKTKTETGAAAKTTPVLLSSIRLVEKIPGGGGSIVSFKQLRHASTMPNTHQRCKGLRLSNSANITPLSFADSLKTTTGSSIATSATPNTGDTCRNSSTSSAPPKKAEESSGEEEIEVESVAEARVKQQPEPKEERKHSHIEMPSIIDTEREGTLTSWNVKVGDTITAGDVVCEIELEQFSVGVKVETSGFLAEILVEAGTENVRVGAPIATVVQTEEDIALFQGVQETKATPPTEKQEENKGSTHAEQAFSWKDVLKTVQRLRQGDKFSEGDASTLMSLARKKDDDLLQAFEGCFEGDKYDGEIDDELFIVQAVDIAKTRRKE